MNPSKLRDLGIILSVFCLGLMSYTLLGSPSERLPDPIGIQWGFTGGATTCAPLPLFCVLAIGTTAVLVGLQIRDYFGSGYGEEESYRVNLRLPEACLSLSSFFMAGIWSNLGAPRCEAAKLSWPAFGAALLLSFGLSRLTRRFDTELHPTPKLSLGLSKHEKAVWVKQVYAPKLVLIGFAALAVLTFVSTSPGPMRYLGSGVLAMVLLSFARIRVQVSSNGVQVYYGIWPVPFTRVPLSEIRSASVDTLAPGTFASWGYRGSLRLYNEATILIRSGPMLCLSLTRGRRLRITVDDPETAAGLLNDMCADRESSDLS